ncbi:hypothetical protein B484DRAFT_453626 [Ochromonadaceae sp. CCMP2298]|nr:hypothetical protein B484DRAFT_453626 [Ochromonadaceae sp. CCMP2298]
MGDRDGGIPMQQSSPLHDPKSEKERKLGQLDPHLEPSTKRMKGLRSAKRIAKYDMNDLRTFRALTIQARTVMANADTWQDLGILTALSMATFFIMIPFRTLCMSYPVADSENYLNAKMSFLISLILSSYVGLSLSRRQTIRDLLGKLWGSLENLAIFQLMLLKDEHEELQTHIIRQARLCFQLTFMSSMPFSTDEAMLRLRESGLLLEKEEEWLRAAGPGTRPLVVAGWLGSTGSAVYRCTTNNATFPDLLSHPKGLDLILNVKGGVGAVLGATGTQPPFMYVHLVYWSVQVFLVFLSVNTGAFLAGMWYRRSNGNEGYQYDDDDENLTYPFNQQLWYVDTWMIRVAGNVFFAVFVEGLLKLGQHLENPLSNEEQGFPYTAYDTFMNNNIRAFCGGFHSADSLLASTGAAAGLLNSKKVKD